MRPCCFGVYKMLRQAGDPMVFRACRRATTVLLVLPQRQYQVYGAEQRDMHSGVVNTL